MCVLLSATALGFDRGPFAMSQLPAMLNATEVATWRGGLMRPVHVDGVTGDLLGAIERFDTYAWSPDCEWEPAELVKLLDAAQQARKLLKGIEDTLEGEVVVVSIEHGIPREWRVEGVGNVERYTGSDRDEWTADALRDEVRRKVAFDRESGDLDGVALRTWEKINELFRLDGSNVRITALRANEIDPNEYRRRIGARTRIRIVRDPA